MWKLMKWGQLCTLGHSRHDGHSHWMAIVVLVCFMWYHHFGVVPTTSSCCSRTIIKSDQKVHTENRLWQWVKKLELSSRRLRFMELFEFLVFVDLLFYFCCRAVKYHFLDKTLSQRLTSYHMGTCFQTFPNSDITWLVSCISAPAAG